MRGGVLYEFKRNRALHASVSGHHFNRAAEVQQDLGLFFVLPENKEPAENYGEQAFRAGCAVAPRHAGTQAGLKRLRKNSAPGGKAKPQGLRENYTLQNGVPKGRLRIRQDGPGFPVQFGGAKEPRVAFRKESHIRWLPRIANSPFQK
jgi:hypothetical protein